jgi:hypothetical protein
LSQGVRDVFISYSHKDNLSLSDDQLGWVDRFHRALSVRLTQLLGRDSRLFFDKAVMSGNHVLSPKIRSEIAEAKVLVSIISPGYLQSEWCNEELSQFAAAAALAGGVSTGTTSRIIKVLKLPVEPQQEKKAKVDLSDVLGYKFYRTDTRGVASEFDLDDEPQNRREFVKRVNELAYDVCKILDMLGEELPNRAQVVASTGKTVYIAETSSDVADEADRLRSELAQYGHTVVPQRDLSHGPQFADIAASEMAKADLSIHLVGSVFAAVPEREYRSIVEVQCDVAAAEKQRRHAFRQIVWSPPNTAPDDERQLAFLSRLDGNAQRIIAPFDTLKQTVRAALEAPAAPEAPPVRTAASADANGQVSIYLIYDLSDRDLIQPLDDALFNAGFDVLTPMFDGDEARIRKHEERCLTECDAVLIFAANAPADWLTQRAIDLQKAPAYGRTKSFLAQGVALGPPRTVDKDRFRRQSIARIELYDGVTAGTLEPFLEAIARARSVNV